MSPNGRPTDRQLPARRPVRRARLAAAVFALAAFAAPLCAMMITCAMPCCDEPSIAFVQSAEAAACAEHCGISNVQTSHELPDAMAPSTETPQISLASLGVAEAIDALTTHPPRLPSRSFDIHHATPGDAPLHIYNSVFLI